MYLTSYNILVLCDNDAGPTNSLFNSKEEIDHKTKYHPAGYSSGYSASKKFVSRIFGWNILLLMQKKITNYGQNDPIQHNSIPRASKISN